MHIACSNQRKKSQVARALLALVTRIEAPTPNTNGVPSCPRIRAMKEDTKISKIRSQNSSQKTVPRRSFVAWTFSYLVNATTQMRIQKSCQTHCLLQRSIQREVKSWRRADSRMHNHCHHQAQRDRLDWQSTCGITSLEGNATGCT